MIIGFAHRVRKDIQEEIESVTHGLTSGAPNNFEEYRYLVGKKLGLETALAVVDDALRAFEKQN